MRVELFDFAAERLEHHTSLDRLEARGTLRIAIKIAGLPAKSVNAAQLCVVFEKVMPHELENRGVSDAAVACSAVIDESSRPQSSRRNASHRAGGFDSAENGNANA